MKLLSGSELAGFIKERQAKAVRGLRQAHGVQPKLAIIVTVDNPIIEIYMRLKKNYGTDILVDVDVHQIKQTEIKERIAELNNDPTVHGIIVQLPLDDSSETDKILALISPAKDVDALSTSSVYDPATPTAILWLLAGYAIDLQTKKVVLVGKGRLVGQPLLAMLQDSGVQVTACDENDNVGEAIASAEVIVTATGNPRLLTSKMIPGGCVVVDAGVAVEQGKSVGDLADDVYERDDLTITPKKGGVGPLTVCALFENVIKAARQSASSKMG